MNFCTEKLPENFANNAVRLFDILEKSNPEWEKTANLISSALDECTLLLKKEPENEIIKHNYELLLAASMAFELGCFL